MAVNLSTFLPGWGTGTLKVEVAWGADLTAASTSWSWTDITTDVRLDPGIETTLGRGDEASESQPAECSMVLDNTGGEYSLGGQSSNYPNVRRGTPVRVSIDPDGAGYLTSFFGFATGFTPSWELTGDIATVQLNAAGTLRRLEQGKSPVQSSLRKGLADDSTLVGYWPCEEGKNADHFEPAVGTQPMIWVDPDAPPDLATNTSFDSSLPIPVLKNSEWRAELPAYTGTGEAYISMLFEFPEDLEADAYLLSIDTTGTAARWGVRYDATGSGGLALDTFSVTSGVYTQIDTSGTVGFNVHEGSRPRRLTLDLVQNGGNIDWELATLSADQVASGGAVDTVVGVTLGTITSIRVNALGILDDVAVGHLAVYDASRAFASDFRELTAWYNEVPTSRLARLASENNETIDIQGSSGLSYGMGTQTPDTLVSLLRECETADQGVLLDGLSAGLTYIARSQRENQSADLVIAAASRQLAPPFAPVDDDQRTRNEVTAQRKDGAPVTVRDVDGPLGTETVGIYDTSLDVNVALDSKVADFAGWLVHLGTTQGYRYPQISVDLRATPSLARDLLACTPSSRVDITGLSDTLSNHPGSTLSLLMEGFQQTIAAGTWRVTAPCSPYDPWIVGVAGVEGTTPVTYVGSGSSASLADSQFGEVGGGLPSGILSGDLLLILASVRNSGTGTINTPTDWTNLFTSGNVTLLGRIAEGSDSHPNISATGGATNATLFLRSFAFRGTSRDITDVVVASAASLNASAQNIAYPSLTVPIDNCAVVVAAWKQDDWTSVATLAGMTEAFDESTTLGSDAGLVVDYVLQTAHANITGSSLVVTGGASAISRGITIALRPDPDPVITRLDTRSSQLAAGFSAGATSISVTTNSGDVWTTASADFPYSVLIGGVEFTVTACSDGTSPQTMTISAASMARSSGATFELAEPAFIPL